MRLIRAGIASPSWKGRMQGIQHGASILRSAGFDPILGDVTTGCPSFDPYGHLDERVRELVGFLRDPDIDVVWIADGGMGACHLLPKLAEEWAREPWPRKPVIGFSDASFILLYLVKLGHVCYYAPNVLCEDEEDARSLNGAAVLLGGGLLRFGGPFRVRHAVDTLRSGRATGTLLSGNFSVMREMLGTPYAPSFDGSLVFFEEHGFDFPGQAEYLLWFFTQGIELGGWWDRVAAFMVGGISFKGPYETEQDQLSMWDVLQRFLLPRTAGPVAAGFPFRQDHMPTPMPLGVEASLSVQGGMLELEMDLQPIWR